MKNWDWDLILFCIMYWSVMALTFWYVLESTGLA